MADRRIVVPPEHLFPPDEWRIVEAPVDARVRGPGRDGAGAVQRLPGRPWRPDEGRPVLAPGMFINGFHETWPIIHAEDAYGLARVGQTIVNVPDATIIELYVDDEPLFVPTARTPEYRRVLDMRNGVLTRDSLWATPSGKHVRVRSTRLVSFEHRHVVADLLRGDASIEPRRWSSAPASSTGPTPGATVPSSGRRERSAHRPAARSAGARAAAGGARRGSVWCSAIRRSRAG